MKPYRDGSALTESYNSGLVVFLYDESYMEAINEASPKILEYFDDVSHEDPALKKLAEEGVLAVYTLAQDDELAVEVSVGPPLTGEELKGFPSDLPPATTLIKLPTGRLCIEGYDSLRVGPEAEYIEEEGSVVEVPPGEYTLTVYREDPFYGDDDDEDYDSEDKERPTQIITLSNPAQVPPPDERPSMMLFTRD